MDVANAKIFLRDIKQCAVDAGIYAHWFISFGTLLGAVRPTKRGTDFVRGIMAHDDDMDVCILRDNITKAQEDAYIENLRSAGAFKCREIYQRRDDDHRLLWCSCRREKAPAGTKCCNWFFYEWKGFLWHSKGKDWLNEQKFPSRLYPHTQEDAAMAKGIPVSYFGGLMEAEFEGELYNMPVNFGHCMDFWYPEWYEPKKGGASKSKYIMKIGRWGDESTYRIF